jgi:hypothetical protein
MSLFRGLGARKDSVRGTSPIEVRKAFAGLFASTGVLPGGASPLLTGDATWAYNVGIANFVTSRGASDGDQLYGNDGVTLIGATGVGSTVPIAPGAGLSRIDIAWTRHPTNGENGDTSSEPLFGVASGTAASSSPVAPVIPAGALELGRNLMTSAATSTLSAGNTITQSAPVASLVGVPVGAWTAYTPTLTAVTTNPTLGTGGSATGRYTQVDKTVTGWATITFGSGFTAGSGIYSVSLPVAPLTTTIQAGSGRIKVASLYSRVNLFTTSTAVNLEYATNIVNGSVAYVASGAGAPGTWAANDEIRVWFSYEAA